MNEVEAKDMHRGSLAALVLCHAVSVQAAYAAIDEQLRPNWVHSAGPPGGWAWDYWQLGGLFSGYFDGYDPKSDPDNCITCYHCADSNGKDCPECANMRRFLLPPLLWRRHDGDLVPVDGVAIEGSAPDILVLPDGKIFIQHDFPDSWLDHVREQIDNCKRQGTHTWAAIIECHLGDPERPWANRQPLVRDIMRPKFTRQFYLGESLGRCAVARIFGLPFGPVPPVELSVAGKSVGVEVVFDYVRPVTLSVDVPFAADAMVVSRRDTGDSVQLLGWVDRLSLEALCGVASGLACVLSSLSSGCVRCRSLSTPRSRVPKMSSKKATTRRSN